MSAPKITGYRALTGAEIAIINRVKAKAEEVRELLAEIGKLPDAWIGKGTFMGEAFPVGVEIGKDPRWFAIGQTDLQKGFMAVIRAIARPETF